MAAGLLMLGALLAPPEGAGQDYRGWAHGSVRYVEARPLGLDSIPRDQVEAPGGSRFVFQGQPVQCVSASTCVRYVPLPVDEAMVFTQDVSATAWGLGVSGLSVTAMLRARARLGGDFVWPRSRDELDMLLAYAQLVRGPLRFRLGRLRTLSGLGFSGYDGASVLYTPLPRLTLEAYGGRSLAQGLNEPRNEALRGIQDFIFDQDAWLVGGFLRAELIPGTSVGLRYQREIWSDRSGLLSERASVDFRSDLMRPGIVEGSADWDVAFDRVGKAHLTLRLPLATRRLVLEGTVRRYLPYFELSTIWGFFSPTEYTELEGRGSWTIREGLTVRGMGGWRSYGDTHTSAFGEPLEDTGWRVGTGLSWIRGPWTLQGSYRAELGPGAFLSTGEGTLRWRSQGGLTLGVQGSAFQAIEEFRVGEGVVVGGGGTVGLDLPGRSRLDGGVSFYRHLSDGSPVETDWSQVRAWSSFRVELGGDPGPAGRLRR